MKPRRSQLLASLLAAALPAAASAGARNPAGATRPASRPAAIQIEQALENLRAEDWILQLEALRLLTRWRVNRAAGPLRAVLAGKAHPWVRGRALVALAELLGKAAADDVRRQARSPVPELRAAAMESLGLLADPQGAPAVRRGLDDPARIVRCEAVVALARLLGPDAWGVVSPRLGDADAAVAKSATRALAHVPTDDARCALIRHLDHADESVRDEAAKVARRVRLHAAIPALLKHMASDRSRSVRAACEKALASFDAPAVAAPLLEALRSDQTALYPAALKILALRPAPAVAEALASIVGKPRKQYAGAAAAALRILGRVRPERYRDIFVRYLDSADASTRAAAAAGVGACKEADHFALLRARLTDADASARQAAYESLRKATRSAPAGGILSYLAPALRHDVPEIRLEALGLLGERLTPAEVPGALAMLDGMLGGGGEELRASAARALDAATDRRAKYQVAAAQGYLARWRVIGPFPRIRQPETRYPPEWEIDFGRKYELCLHPDRASARAATASCNRIPKPSILLRPPSGRGMTFTVAIATYLLDLPEAADLKLTFSVGLTDKSRSADGARFELRVDGKTLFQRDLSRPAGWHDAEANLAPFAGRKVALELFIDGIEDTDREEVAVGRPRVLAAGKEVLDLTRVSQIMPIRTSFGDKKLPMIGWRLCPAGSVDGTLDFRQLFDGPREGTVYAVADFDSPAERAVRLTVRVDNVVALRLNGEPLEGDLKWHHWQLGELRLTEGMLKKGRNRLFLRIGSGAKGWFLRLRVADAAGRRLPSLVNATR